MTRTGREHLESIGDAREIYVIGEKVEDVTARPMFKPLVDIRVRIYDMAHEDETREVLGYEKSAGFSDQVLAGDDLGESGDPAVSQWFTEQASENSR